MTVPVTILEIPRFFTEKECKSFIEKSESVGYEKATINTELGPRSVEQMRNNERIIFDDSALANQLWLRIKDHIPQKIGLSMAQGLNERMRFYKYQPGQVFRKHRDESYIRNESEASYYTLLIYLNDDFTGGETQFQNRKVKPQSGKALVFLHQLEHEGSQVTNGIKYVLRTDVMYKLSV